MSRRGRVMVVALTASLAWIVFMSVFAHLRYVHRPRMPDDAYRETTSTIQNFGNLAGIGLFFTLANRTLKKGDPLD